MFKVNIERIGEVAVIHCEGRVVQSTAAFRLPDAVTQQRDARVIRRFIYKLRGAQVPQAKAIILTEPGEEAQVDYGTGAQLVSGASREVPRSRATRKLGSRSRLNPDVEV